MKKIYQLIIFATLIQITSCNQVTKTDLIGEWRAFTLNDNICHSNIKFSNDKVQLLDYFSRIESGKYYLKNNELHINLKNYNLKSKVKIYNNDSIKIFDKIFYKVEDLNNFELDEYNLIGIDSNEKLSKNTISHSFHIYSKSGTEKIRYNDKIISLNDLRRAIFGGHHNENPTIELFVGENVKLENLKNFYNELGKLGIKKIVLIVNKKNSTDYRVINDNIGVSENNLSTNNELIKRLK